MTEQELKALRERPTTLYEKWLEVRVQELEQENARLRGLIKQEEAGDDGWCPWCHTDLKHYATCPAFTPNGEVK